MKSDEEKLKELFEMKEKPTFKDTVKKAKTLSIIRTAMVSLMIFIIVAFVVLMSNALILNNMSNGKEHELRNWFNIAMPNGYMGNTQVDDRIMVGNFEYTRYRFLGQKPIVDGSFKEDYSYMPLINGLYGDRGYYLFGNSGSSDKELQEMKSYNKEGKAVMKFYHPLIKYESYINDLKNLNEIDSNKLMEMSLSFDKAYSLEEVKNMIPKDVTLNWYWVDTFNENDILKNNNTDNIYKEKTVIFDEYNVYGIKALDRQGRPAKNPEVEFIDSIIRGKENKKDHSGRYESLFNTLSNGKGEISKEDLKIIGVVVSGDVETLKALKDKDYIKASTIGAVADKY